MSGMLPVGSWKYRPNKSRGMLSEGKGPDVEEGQLVTGTSCVLSLSAFDVGTSLRFGKNNGSFERSGTPGVMRGTSSLALRSAGV